MADLGTLTGIVKTAATPAAPATTATTTTRFGFTLPASSAAVVGFAMKGRPTRKRWTGTAWVRF